MPKANMVGNENLARRQERMPAETRVSAGSRIAGWIFTPALAPMMRNYRITRILAGLAILQIGLAVAGWRGWQCPVYFTFGVPCPACSLTRSIALLIQGKWHAAVTTHAFAPVFLAAIILLAVSGILPRGSQQYVSLQVAAVEKHTGIVAILLLSMLVYWGLRISGLIGPPARL